MRPKLVSSQNRILMLGASGRLGTVLRRLWTHPDALILQSRKPLAEFVKFDPLTNAEKLANTAKGASTMICLAGVTPDHAARTGDPYSLNVDLAIAAVKAAHYAKIDRVLLASSAAVYGSADGILNEQTHCLPESEYGWSKLEMEQRALEVAAALGQKVTVLRIGNVAGGDAVLGGWRPGMELDLFPYGDGPSRSYIGPHSFCRVIQALCFAPDLPDILNVATPGTVAMADLLDAAYLDWTPRPAAKGVIPHVALCTKQLHRSLGYRPDRATAANVVAEWRRFQAIGNGPENDLAQAAV